MSANTESFDDFMSTERQMDQEDLPPFQFRDSETEYSGDKGLHDWLTQNYDNHERSAHSRLITYRRYQALYKNIHWRFFDTRDSNRDSEYSARRPRHSVNFIYEMVEGRVAQNARLKADLAFIPQHDEPSDVNNAKACKLLYDSRAADLGLEEKHQKCDRSTFIFGHSFVFIEWDEEEGPVSPYLQEIMDANGGELPKEIKKQLKKKGVINIGDVSVETLGPDRVHVEQNKRTWDEVNWIERIDFMDIHEVKARWPEHKEDITGNERQIFDFDSSELIRPKNLILIRTFYHKPTKFLPEGARIVHCDDVVLEKGKFPYEDGLLPCVPDTDIDVYGEFWGRSFISNIEQMQRFYNNIQSATARDFSIASAPKWMMPKGACNVSSLGNDLTIVEFQGPIAPQLVQSSPTSPQAFNIQEGLEKKISQHSGVYDISRGEVPSGVTANSALRFLDEQESQRTFVSQNKRKHRVVNVAKMMLSRMKQFYKPNDGRMVHMLGKNNEYLIKSMQSADFTKINDVVPQNSSALPDTKVGKISAIIDLNTATQTDPIFRKEEIVEMLDLGNDEYFKDRATVAVTAANQAFQMFMDGEMAPPPMANIEFLVHYSVFFKQMQTMGFMKLDPEVQEGVRAHVKAIEYLMFERSKKNMKFCTQVMELDMYPMYYTSEVPLTEIMRLHNMQLMAPAPEAQPNIETQKIEKPTN